MFDKYLNAGLNMQFNPVSYSQLNYIDAVTAMEYSYGEYLRNVLNASDLEYIEIPTNAEFSKWFYSLMDRGSQQRTAFDVNGRGKVVEDWVYNEYNFGSTPMGTIFNVPCGDVTVPLVRVQGRYFAVAKAMANDVKACFTAISYPAEPYRPEMFEKIHLTNMTDIAKKDVLFFANSYPWFRGNDVPYKRSYLLYGPPGNGKSTFVRLVCKYFGVKSKTFDFSAGYSAPDTEFISWASGGNSASDEPVAMTASDDEPTTPDKMQILVLEDIDRYFPKDGKETSVSLATLLNVLDGEHTPEHTVIFATANHPENLDQQVLLRPGRFDRRIEFSPPKQVDAYRFLRNRFPESVTDEVLQEMAERFERQSYAFFKELYIGSACAAFNRESTVVEDLDVRKVAGEQEAFICDELTVGTNKKKGNIGFGS